MTETPRSDFETMILPFNVATTDGRTVMWQNVKGMIKKPLPVTVGQSERGYPIGEITKLWESKGWLWGSGTIELGSESNTRFAIEPALRIFRSEMIDPSGGRTAMDVSIIVREWDLAYVKIGTKPAWPESYLEVKK